MSKNQKKIWITGASSGIGKAVAEKFSNEGWKVAVSARRKEILDNMAKTQNIFSYPLDVINWPRRHRLRGRLLRVTGSKPPVPTTEA